MEKNLILFKWYDKFHKQIRFDKECHVDCQFKLITDRNHLLPFQFSRQRSPSPIKNFIVRPSCNPLNEMVLTEGESKFIDNTNWIPVGWSISSGYAIPVSGPGSTLKRNGIFTIGQTYKIRISILERNVGTGSTLAVGIDAGVSIGTIANVGLYEFTFTATSTNLTFTQIGGLVGDMLKVDEVYIEKSFSIGINDIVLDNSLIAIKTFGDKDYFIYFGDNIGKSIDCGDYYAIIKTGDNIYVSEVFTIKEFLPQKSPYLKLTWGNSCDLAGIIYHEIIVNGFPRTFVQWAYLESNLSSPEYPFSEEVEENGDADEIPVFQKWSKKSILKEGLCPEFVVDALTGIRLHETINITKPINIGQPYIDEPINVTKIEYNVDWVVEDCFALVELKLLLDENHVDENCCENNQEEECVVCECKIGVENVFDCDYSCALMINGDENDGLYKNNCDNDPQWLFIGNNVGLAVCYDIDGFTRFWYKFEPGTPNTAFGWALVPVIFNVNFDSINNTIEVIGLGVYNSFAQIEYSFNGTNWFELGDPIPSEYLTNGYIQDFNVPCCGNVHIRFKMFSWNCDYNYSNTIITNFSTCC